MGIIIKTILMNCLFIFFSISVLFSQAAPSDKDYKELCSEHFTIVYYTEKSRAEKILLIAEKVHDKLAKKFYIDDDIHTYLLLLDNSDIANGLATIVPDNTVVLFDIPPELFTEFSLLNYYKWTEELIIHEYTHILHLSQARGFIGILRYIGIKYAALNPLLPLSSIEGLAVGMETAYSPMGRARSSYKEMVLRTAVYEDNIPSIDQISTFINDIPRGEGPYIWGGSFHYYMLRKISEPNLLITYYDNSGCISSAAGCLNSKMSTCASSCFTLFPLNSIFEKYTGISYYTYYDKWTRSLKKKYKKEISRIKDPTGPLFLKEIGNFWNIFDLQYYENKIYFSANSPHTGYGLYEYDLDSKELDIIIEDIFIGSITVCNKSLYFSGLEIYNNQYRYYSLYKFDPNSEELTHYEQIKRTADIAGFDDNLLVVMNKDDGRAIKIITPDGKELETVMELNKYESAYDFNFISKDEFYFILKKENDFFDIYYYNIKNKDLKRITNNPCIETSLFLDRKDLYFISDYNKRFNIYKYDIEKSFFYRNTDFISGVTRFVKEKDEFYAVYYKSVGYSIVNLDEKSIKEDKVEYNKKINFHNFFLPEKEQPVQEVEVSLSEETDFSMIKSLFSSMIFLPTLSSTISNINPGIYFLFSDIQGRNLIGLQLEYNSFVNEPSGGLDYSIYFNKVSFHLRGSSFFQDYFADKEWLNEGEDIYKRVDDITGELHFFKNKLFQSVSFLFGGSYYLKTHFLFKTPGKKILNIQRSSYNSIYFGLDFDNTVSYAWSVIPEKGWDLSARYTVMKDWLESDFDADLLDISIDKYYRTLFRHHILKIDLQGGFLLNDSDDTPYTVKGSGLLRRIYFSALYEKSLHAYSYYEKDGRNYFIGNLSYNFPLFWLERGIKNMPLLFSHMWMNFFYEAGNSYNTIKGLKPLQMVGSELHLVVKFYYRVEVDLTAGISYELERQKGLNFYFQQSMRI